MSSARPRSPLRRAGRVLAIGLAAGSAAWVYAGSYEPLRGDDSVDVLFFSPALAGLLVPWAIVSAIVLAGEAAGRRWAPGSSGACLAPLWLAVFALVPILLLPTPVYAYAAPWAHLFLDSRWAFVAAILAMIAWSVVTRGCPGWWSVRAARLAELDRAPSAGGRLGLDLLLATLLVTVSFASSPPVRFTSLVIGDEPKYVRYLENWFQGRGMDITGLGPVENLPPGDTPSLTGNLRRFGEALAVMPADLRADLAWLAGQGERGPVAPRVPEGGWFVQGKHGGVYQVHNPGSSALLFPGYVLDRLVNWTGPPRHQFAEPLALTNLSVLLIYVLWGIALFRLLEAFSGRALLSAAIAAIAMISLPASAFAYQYYPEAAGGLFVTVLARFALLSREARISRMAWHGLAAGYLPWIHVRFLLLALVVLCTVLVTRRRHRASVAVFAAAWALPVAALGAYYYYISGSPMPWALYALTADTAAFDPTRVRHLPVYWFDRAWGLVGHAPIYLAAAAGARLAWRWNRLAAAGAAAFVMALAFPAATHELTGGGTTPLRLIAAVVPLLAIHVMGVALAPARPVARAALIILAVLSLQNAWMFNSTMMRFAPWLQGPTPSGWLTTLMMPHFDLLQMHRDPLSLFWAAATIGLLVWGPALVVGREEAAGRRAGGMVPAAAWSLGGFALLGSGLAALSDQPFHPRLMPGRDESARRLLAFHLEQPRGGVRWSARHGGQADPVQVLANPRGSTVTLSPEHAGPDVDETVTFTITGRAPDGGAAWGRAALDYGDGTPPVRLTFFGEASVRHAYATAGTFGVRVAGEMPGAGTFSIAGRVVAGVPFERRVLAWCTGDDGPALMPVELEEVAPALAVERIKIEPHRIRLTLAPRSADAPRGRDAWAWIASPEAGVEAIPIGADGLPDVFEVPMRTRKSGQPVCVVAAERTGEGWRAGARTPIVRVEWPPATLLDAGVDLTPSEAARWTWIPAGATR